MSSIPLNITAIKDYLSKNTRDNILVGLKRGSTGFLIAPPDTGKSYICLSIAYELALPAMPSLIGVRANQNKPYRTLIWAPEDGVDGTCERISNHLASFSDSICKDLETNVSIYPNDDAFSDVTISCLMEEAKDYDLLIIDTLREAIGALDEVKDDAKIRIWLDKIAKGADVAILVVHHPTKEISRGQGIVNSVAGSGLSSTLSKSKLHLYAYIIKSRLCIRHIKSNYVPVDEKITDLELHWSPESIVCRDIKDITPFRQLTKKPRRAAKKIPDIPTVMEHISQESRDLAARHDQTLHESSLSEQLRKRAKRE